MIANTPMIASGARFPVDTVNGISGGFAVCNLI